MRNSQAIILFVSAVYYLPEFVHAFRYLVRTSMATALKADTMDELFEQYVRLYNKSYRHDSVSARKNYQNFEQSVRRILEKNERQDDVVGAKQEAVYGLTEFSDLSAMEFRRRLTLTGSQILPASKHHISRRSASGPRPERFDWRDKNVISAIKDQHDCGACWAFSTVELVETLDAIQTGNLRELSVQQMLDCSNETNMGCDGGDTCAALRWLVKYNVHLVPSVQYPFQAQRGRCRWSSSGIAIGDDFICRNYVNAEENILDHIAFHGPVAAAVDATSWQDYLGGIIRYHCERSINHAVQIIGYDMGEDPHYIVRNSWGTSYGNGGYMRIAFGNNVCGIAQQITAVKSLKTTT